MQSENFYELIEYTFQSLFAQTEDAPSEKTHCCKSIPVQTWTGPWGSSRLRLSEFLYNRHMKVAELSAPHNGRLYWYSLVLKAESTLRPLCGRKYWVNEKYHDPIGNGTRDLPACSAVQNPSCHYALFCCIS